MPKSKLDKSKQSLLHFYRKLLFHEQGNLKLRASIRESMKQLRDHGLDDVEDIIKRLRKQCTLVRARRLRAKLLHQIRNLKCFAVYSSTSSSLTSPEQSESESESEKEESNKQVEDEKSTDEDSSSSTDETRYKVQSIMGFRIREHEPNARRQYLVRWKGYGSDDDTWEPVDRLMEDQCGDLVARFHREHMRFH
jgi:hypothetical protein